MSKQTCRQCGSQFTSKDEFCPSCGTRVQKKSRGKTSVPGSRDWTLIAVAGFGALLLVIALVLVFNPGKSGDQPTAAVPGADSNLPHPGVPRIDIDAARTAFDQDAVFLDIRTPKEFGESHVPGSIMMPITELASRMNEVPAGATIITYCT